MSEIERERGQVQQMKLEPMAFSGEPHLGSFSTRSCPDGRILLLGRRLRLSMWGEMSGDLKTYQLDNIPPNFPVSPTVGVGDERLTSGYGFRRDPITNQEGNKHGGIDF